MTDSSASKVPVGPCPQCGTRSRLDADNHWQPFCSERCKLLDLGHWFEGRYALQADDDAGAETPPQTLQ